MSNQGVYVHAIAQEEMSRLRSEHAAMAAQLESMTTELAAATAAAAAFEARAIVAESASSFSVVADLQVRS